MTVTPEKIRFAMRKLKAAVPDGPGMARLNMSVHYVEKNPECGTTACLGGWYELADRMEKGTVEWGQGPLRGILLAEGMPEECGDILEANYTDGAEKMARDMGFFNADCLYKWVTDNPHVWGNFSGSAVFSSARAYGSRDGFITIWNVIDHWNDVADRLEKFTETPLCKDDVRRLRNMADVMDTAFIEGSDALRAAALSMAESAARGAFRTQERN